MRPLTCLLLLLLDAHLLLTSPLTGGCGRDANCPKCRAGEFKKSCGCVQCPQGTYMPDSNCDTSCHPCFSDCRPDLNLKVIRNCSSTSNLQCRCKEGFDCTDQDRLSGNCRYCQRSPDYPTTAPSTGQSSTWSQPCSDPNRCSPAPISGNATEPRTDTTQKQLIAILCPLVIIGGLALVLILCFGCPGHETRLKQTVKKLCSVEAKDSVHKTRETSRKQQTVPVATANMGSVHVHNPGTVIFSLLGEFSGQIGQKKEEKTEAKEPSDVDDAYCTVCQPTPSPTLPLSEEEHPGDHVFFPSQEQGKDSRVSVEEKL